MRFLVLESLKSYFFLSAKVPSAIIHEYFL